MDSNLDQIRAASKASGEISRTFGHREMSVFRHILAPEIHRISGAPAAPMRMYRYLLSAIFQKSDSLVGYFYQSEHDDLDTWRILQSK